MKPEDGIKSSQLGELHMTIPSHRVVDAVVDALEVIGSGPDPPGPGTGKNCVVVRKSQELVGRCQNAVNQSAHGPVHSVQNQASPCIRCSTGVHCSSRCCLIARLSLRIPPTNSLLHVCQLGIWSASVPVCAAQSYRMPLWKPISSGI